MEAGERAKVELDKKKKRIQGLKAKTGKELEQSMRRLKVGEATKKGAAEID